MGQAPVIDFWLRLLRKEVAFTLATAKVTAGSVAVYPAAMMGRAAQHLLGVFLEEVSR